jgi:predicted nucleotide-binding protein
MRVRTAAHALARSLGPLALGPLRSEVVGESISPSIYALGKVWISRLARRLTTLFVKPPPLVPEKGTAIMAPPTQPSPKQLARLSVDDMKSALPKLQRRLDEVNAIDPTQATGRFTAEFSAINDNVNATLMEIFGPNSIEYDRYKSVSIYAGRSSYAREIPRHEVIQGYTEGKKRVFIKLDAAIKFINEKLADARVTAEPLELQERRKSNAARTTIFIGHGGSPIWRELKDFLEDRLQLPVDEFNSVAVAGIPTVTRLEEMLDAAAFAFLVMTAEDALPDDGQGHLAGDPIYLIGDDGLVDFKTHSGRQGLRPVPGERIKLHARLNVVHEAGLFQGRLGFKKAIILLEDGCEEFSNIHGLGQIRFPKGNINAKFEEIRAVLEREGLAASI